MQRHRRQPAVLQHVELTGGAGDSVQAASPGSTRRRMPGARLAGRAQGPTALSPAYRGGQSDWNLSLASVALLLLPDTLQEVVAFTPFYC